MIIKSGSHQYLVGNLVADAGQYRLYLCEQVETGRQCLLQIAAEASFNGAIVRAAHVLKELLHRATDLEEQYAKVRTNPKAQLNYDLSFPSLEDSFSSAEQGDRQVNIISFRNVEAVTQMVPLQNIRNKDHQRIDARTSAWIMGKLLKILTFTHSIGIENRRLTGSNILIEPKEHYVVLFDWLDAYVHVDRVPSDVARREIVSAAQAVITAMGADSMAKLWPDLAADLRPYTDFLTRLSAGNYREAKLAHADFYELIDTLWERAYYPFTAVPQ